MKGFAVVLIQLLLCAAITSAADQNAQSFPRIRGESFAGREIDLPDAVLGKVTVMIFGFTKASGTPTGVWAKRISADFGSRNGFEVYQLPVLEDVPRLFRGMVISGIKKGVPQNEREHFVPILQGEAELKKAVSYSQPGDAYLVVLDRQGKVVQQMHGSLDDARYSQLRAELESLLR